MSWLHSDHGQDDSITYARQDEARKEALRQRIAAMFGEDTKGFRNEIRGPDTSFSIGEDRGIAHDLYPTSGEGRGPLGEILELAPALSGAAARDRFSSEEGDLSSALRGFYGDDLKQRYGDAERAVRFGAARTGNIGSTGYADAIAKVNRDNALAGTNIEEAVRRSIGNLRASREDVRSRATGLVNAGQGEEGVRSATAGLKSAAEAASSANRERLFDDYFRNLAYTGVASNQASQTAQLAALLNRGSGSFFSTSPSTGRVI